MIKKSYISKAISVILTMAIMFTFLPAYSNNIKVSAAVNALWPLPSNCKNITGHFDNRRNTVNPENTGYHNAMDIAASYGTNIYAVYDGTVIFSGWKNSYGNFVVLYHSSLGVYTFYAHASSLVATKGSTVKQGDIIAKVGSTGNSSGNHLHFGVCNNVDSAAWPRRTYYNPETYFNFTYGTTPPNTTPYIKITDFSQPTGTLIPGKFFAIKGKIEAYPKIEAVYGGVYNADGTYFSDDF